MVRELADSISKRNTGQGAQDLGGYGSEHRVAGVIGTNNRSYGSGSDYTAVRLDSNLGPAALGGL